mmetsp:Transcript_4412/g.7405  ORF Transcript_4412/g.7405 Transcript_4412/m.7405 type:complete len:129 (-) Transcript_4412:87-473(-)
MAFTCPCCLERRSVCGRHSGPALRKRFSWHGVERYMCFPDDGHLSVAFPFTVPVEGRRSLHAFAEAAGLEYSTIGTKSRKQAILGRQTDCDSAAMKTFPPGTELSAADICAILMDVFGVDFIGEDDIT